MRPPVGRDGLRAAAQCTVRGGHFFLPTDTPYDRQMLLEHVDRYLRSQGMLRLELLDHEWTVTRRHDGNQSCRRCGATLSSGVQYQIDERRCCRRCAHALLLP